MIIVGVIVVSVVVVVVGLFHGFFVRRRGRVGRFCRVRMRMRRIGR